jgi:hypothetical protein
MLAAIQLHDQTFLNTTKVNDKRTYRMLAAKLDITNLSTAQSRPQLALDVGLIFSELACSAFLQ